MDNYSSFSQCVEECKLGCPKELTCDIDQIKSYCDINHSKYNRSASGCVNYMYNECNCSGTDYIYRPINNSNPFPNSYESPIPGNREIGGNWVGKTEYITEDNNDSTSVTGANAGVSVEYEIHLTPSDIQKIRENTESYVSEGKDPYLDYIGVEQGKDGYCLEDGYCSEFINSSEFSTTIFKVKKYHPPIDSTTQDILSYQEALFQDIYTIRMRRWYRQSSQVPTRSKVLYCYCKMSAV